MTDECGYHDSETMDSPCSRAAGWGRDDVDGQGACKDHVGLADPPDDFDLANLDKYSAAEIEARNRQVEQEHRESVAALDEQQEAAVEGLRSHAQQTADTEQVPLGDATIEVKTRFPPRVETLFEQIQAAQQRGDVDRARRLNCEVAASMVVAPEGYTDPEVWEVAATEHGQHWLGEAVDTIAGPASENAEALQGNSQDSDTTQSQTMVKESGWQRKV